MAVTRSLCRGILKGNSVTKMRCNSKLLIDAINLKMKILSDCREEKSEHNANRAKEISDCKMFLERLHSLQ